MGRPQAQSALMKGDPAARQDPFADKSFRPVELNKVALPVLTRNQDRQLRAELEIEHMARLVEPADGSRDQAKPGGGAIRC